MTEHQIATCGVIAMLIPTFISIYYYLLVRHYDRKRRKEIENRNSLNQKNYNNEQN